MMDRLIEPGDVATALRKLADELDAGKVKSVALALQRDVISTPPAALVFGQDGSAGVFETGTKGLALVWSEHEGMAVTVGSIAEHIDETIERVFR